MAVASASASASAGRQRGNDFAHLFVFANEKAGMQHVDTGHVNQVIYEASKNSSHFREAQRRDAKTQAEVQRMRARLAVTSAGDLRPVRQRVAAAVAALERRRVAAREGPAARGVRIHVVVDMDMFFAAVEMRDDPSLIGKPMAVGGMSMISTANYEARKLGVRSAMPGFIAKKLCPQLIFVKNNGTKYAKASREVREVLREFDPALHGSLDEAYMDLTAYVDRTHPLGARATLSQRMQHAAAVVADMRARVAARTALTCSAGIALTSMLAKVASDKNKPNGQCLVPHAHADMLAFAHALPVRKVPGVGKVTEQKLRASLGIATVGDLWAQRVLCAHLFSANTAAFLLKVGMCCTGPPFDAAAQAASLPFAASTASAAGGEPQKSVSKERTFSQGASDPAELVRICRALCAALAADCVRKGVAGTCVTLKLKSATFEVTQRQLAVTNALPRREGGAELFAVVRDLLRKELPCTLRLMGVRLSRLKRVNEANNTKTKSRSTSTSKGKGKGNSSSEGGSGTGGFGSGSGSGSNGEEEDNEEEEEDNEEDNTEPTSSFRAAMAAAPPLAEETTLEALFANAKPRPGVHCPVCGEDLGLVKNAGLNTHVDACLSGKASLTPVSGAKRAAPHAQPEAGRAKTKAKLTAFFKPAA